MSEPDIATLLAQAQRGADAGRPHAALEALRELAGAPDDACRDQTLESGRALAARTGAHPLELHFALRLWARHPGRPDCRTAVIAAAFGVPEAREAAYRVHHAGRVEDWQTITKADPCQEWPAVDALGPGGAHGARLLGPLQQSGWLEAIDDDDDTVGWSTGPARVTRHGRSVAIGAGDGVSDTSWRYVPALSTWDCSSALRWSDHPPERRRETVAVLATKFSFSGYWHWLMEGLLKLLRLDESGVLAQVDTLLVCVDRSDHAYVTDSVRSAGIDVSTQQVSGPFDIAVDHLIVPGRHRTAGGIVEDVSGQDVATQMRENARFDNAHSIDILRHRLGLGRRGHRRPVGRRLLVSRSDATKRRVTNEPALFAALRRHGFERLVPGSLTFDEQVATFADAEIIVAPHGAALANLLFASPPGAVVELLPANDDRTHYSRLAAELGLRYHAIDCRADPSSAVDMVADVDETVDAVAELLA
jgi:capsular polysaccharide biosynthesis protein